MGQGREGGSCLPSGAAAPHVELSVEMRRATTGWRERGSKCSRSAEAQGAVWVNGPPMPRLIAHGSDPYLVRVKPRRGLGRHL